jgi:hypothetical protein
MVPSAHNAGGFSPAQPSKRMVLFLAFNLAADEFVDAANTET